VFNNDHHCAVRNATLQIKFWLRLCRARARSPSECRKPMQSLYLCLSTDRATVALYGPVCGPVQDGQKWPPCQFVYEVAMWQCDNVTPCTRPKPCSGNSLLHASNIASVAMLLDKVAMLLADPRRRSAHTACKRVFVTQWPPWQCINSPASAILIVAARRGYLAAVYEVRAGLDRRASSANCDQVSNSSRWACNS
jgi:hypothetical protein